MRVEVRGRSEFRKAEVEVKVKFGGDKLSLPQPLHEVLSSAC